jgi:membrane protein DedA with SNARE-associated domain
MVAYLPYLIVCGLVAASTGLACYFEGRRAGEQRALRRWRRQLRNQLEVSQELQRRLRKRRRSHAG